MTWTNMRKLLTAVRSRSVRRDAEENARNLGMAGSRDVGGWQRRLWVAITVIPGLVLLAAALTTLLVRSADGGIEASPSAVEAPPPASRQPADVNDGPRSREHAPPVAWRPPALAPAAPTPAGRPAAQRAPDPVAVRIPTIGVDSSLAELGLNPDDTLEVPDDFDVAGWYVHRSVPGEPGPSVIAGHVDSRWGPGVFYHLGELRPGATVEIERADGSVATFVVTATEEHDKDSFPTDRVYGPTGSPELRLITCGGQFDRSSGHYEDNVIVFADLRNITR